MTHVAEGVLQALADGELSGEGRRVAERHIDACEACREELEQLRSASLELAGALSLLDHPAPQRRDNLFAGQPRREAQRTWGMSRSLPRAAVLVLGFAAAASATIPGSPVRAWLGDLMSPETRVVAVSTPAPAPAEPQPTGTAAAVEEAAAEAGISVLPSQGEVRIVLRDASPELTVHALVVDQPRAGVFARGEAAAARFSTGPGRIEVEGAGSGELRIELPRSSRLATVMVNGREYLIREGDQLRLFVPAQYGAEQKVSFKVQP